MDGCFWHGCPTHFVMPKSNLQYWAGKISGNQARDARIRTQLRADGWIVVEVWEHEAAQTAAELIAGVVRMPREWRRGIEEPQR